MGTYKVKYGDTLSGIARANGTTIDALLKSNPNIKDPNRIFAGADLTLGASAPVVAPTPQPTKTTIAEKASLIPDAPTEDKGVTGYYEQMRKDMEKGIDEKGIRRQIRERYNTQFDALRLAASQKIAEERKYGEGQLGSTRAIQARSGTLGSNFAAAENDQVNRAVQDQANSINSEVNAKIAFLMGESEKDYSAQIASQREAKKKGADEYIKYLNERDSVKQTRATSLAKLFAAQGIDPDTMTIDDVAKLQKTYGLDAASFKTLISDEKARIETEKAKAAAEALKANTFNLSEGQSRYVYDPVTGETKLVAEKAKTYAPKASGGGGSYGGGSGAFGNDLDALIGQVGSSINGKYKQEAFRQQIARARNDQDKISIIAANTAIPGEARTDLVNTRAGQDSLRQAIGMVKNGVKTGVLKAGADYGLGIFGGQVDPAMTQLRGLITAAVQPYRSSITGAAWGTQEEAEYKSLFGSVKDTPETLLTKLENLDRIMNNKRVSIIAATADPLGMNTSFDSYYVSNPLAGDQGGDTSTSGGVQLKSPDGRMIEVAEDKVDQALQAGYTLVN